MADMNLALASSVDLDAVRKNNDRIENLSDVVIFLYRDEYYNFREDDDIHPKGEAEVIVAKNKFGTCGIIHTTFRANIPKFYPDLRSKYFDVF